MYAETFGLLGRQRAWAVHGSGGLDEVSTLGPSEVEAFEFGATRRFLIEPQNFAFASTVADELRGGDARHNALSLEAVLDGSERGPKRDIILLNAACALVVAGISSDLMTALEQAQHTLDSGLAYAVLSRLRQVR